MDDLSPLHGATDSGPEPLHDFSTNANPVPPCPAVRAAAVTRDPDPAYTALRAGLAAAHGVSPDRIVVGAGASELILRLVRRHDGTVTVLGPTFSEYARCARLEDRRLREVTNPGLYLKIAAERESLGFVCWPNNPTGELWPTEFLERAAVSHTLVLDLAYAPLCAEVPDARLRSVMARSICLHAPNKAFGLTGVRAAYAVLPAPDPRLGWLAPSWVLDAAGEAFLRATVEPEARQWLAACRPLIAKMRCELAAGLRGLGCEVRESPATFLLARVGEATAVTRELRARGLRVRDATSFGLPEHIRVSAAPLAAQERLLSELSELLPHRACVARQSTDISP